MKKRMFKFLSVMLALTLMVSAVPLSGLIGLNIGNKASAATELAPTGQCGDNVYWTFDSDTGLLTISGTGAMTNDFYNKPSIKNVVIENGVTSLCRSAFNKCTNLESIEIPESVTTIGSGAFQYCSSLKSITIPQSVKSIGNCAFLYCTGLSSITVDKDNLNYCSDEYGVLYDKKKYELIQYPSGNPRESFHIPDGVIKLAMRSFSDCGSLTSVTLSESVWDIGTTGFIYCGNLTSISVDKYNGSFSSDEYGVLYNVSKTVLIQYPSANERKTFNVPDSVKKIGDRSFYKCANLTNVTIPDSVTSIGHDAFVHCRNLTGVTIPDSVTSIGEDAFLGCSALTSLKISNRVTTISYQAFCLCKSLTSITVPDSVTSIDKAGFASCSNLTSVTILGGVITIGGSAFSSCSSLSSITIPDSLTSIDSYAFNDCTSLTDVYYCGTEEQWNNLEVGSNNDDLMNANIHYGSVPHIHSYETVVTKEATCTEKGEMTYTCSCGDTYTEYIPMIEHKFTHVKEDPTCTKAGSEYDICSECGNIFNEKVLEATGHSYLPLISKDATCTEKGIMTYVCQSCGDYYDEEIPFAGHSLTHVINSASCVENGVEYDLCSECGYKFNEKEIKATGHSYEDTVVQPTHTEKGYTDHICESCGYSFSDTYVDPIGHSYDSEITKPATCTEKGVMTYTCSCGDSYTEDIPLVAHQLSHMTEDPTCTKPGAEYDICTECGNRFNEKGIKATGHSYVPAVTKEVSCTEKGEMTYTCSCGDSYKIYFGTPTGHNYLCEVTVPASCTEKGIKTYICEGCGDRYTEEIDVADHTLTHVVNNASCTANGTEYDICSECGNIFNEKEIAATGHSYIPAVTKEASCTEKGEMTYTCSCGDSYTEDIPLKEHSIVHSAEKATCTESGIEYDICSVCKGIFNETEIPAAGHNYVSGICTVCGKEQNWDYTVNNGTVTITGYAGDDKILEIPSEIGGYPVTAIANEAYAGNTDLEYVSIPNSVFIIGKDAFHGCTNLKEICISDSVSTICEGAFADCTSLAIVFIASANTTLHGAFSNNDPRLSFIVQENTVTASNAAAEGFTCNTYMYPKEKDGKGAIAVSGTVTLYEDLEYFYWSKLIEKYPYAFYLYFDSLVFDGVEEDEVEIVFDESHLDSKSENLTMNEVYISISVDGRSLTFRDLINMLKNGSMDAVITFADSTGVRRNFFQRIGDFFEDVFNLISKAINALVRVFKKK